MENRYRVIEELQQMREDSVKDGCDWQVEVLNRALNEILRMHGELSYLKGYVEGLKGLKDEGRR